MQRGRHRRRDLRQRAVAGSASPDRSTAQAQGGRSNAAHSRHLRPPRESADADNALLVLLDHLIRRVKLADSRALLVSDTVGFIDRLPHALIAAFRATLEEVAEADLIVHVIDAASAERERHKSAVHRVLA